VVSLNVAGAKYSNWEQQPEKSIDPEELRYNQKKPPVVVKAHELLLKTFLYCSILQQTATVNGNFVNRFDLPANLNMQKKKRPS
jgi:hypothetical protein